MAQANKTCEFCGEHGHSKFYCPKRPNKPIPQVSEKTATSHQGMKRRWYKANPADDNGNWTCYLQISVLCPKILDKVTLRLEHVKSKVRYPELKFDYRNIRPACEPCNRIKASLDIEDLVEEYPHLTALIEELQ